MYPVIALPPSLAGATNVAVIVSGLGFGLFIASVTVGGSGTAGVVIPTDSILRFPAPITFMAAILYLYSVFPKIPVESG